MNNEKIENKVSGNAFDKIIGYEDIKAELLSICDYLRYPEKYHKLGIWQRGVYLYGPEGFGKTEIARCLIAESNRELFEIKKDMTDVQMEREFAKAKDRAPSIVLADDYDKLTSGSEITVINGILANYKNDVFVVIVAGKKYEKLINIAGIETIIKVYKPKSADNIKLAMTYLQDNCFSDDVDKEEIARLIAGGGMEHTLGVKHKLEIIISKAASYAFSKGKERIGRRDVLEAIVSFHQGLKFVSIPSNDAEMETVAVHEAGHIVAREFFYPGAVNYAYAGIIMGESAGCVYNICDTIKSVEYRRNRIVISLASKAAVELVLGIAAVGLGSDLSNSFEMASSIVDDNCANGFYSYGLEKASQYLLAEKEKAIADEVARCYQEAKMILAKNRDFLDAVILALKLKNIITYKEIAEIRKKVGAA